MKKKLSIGEIQALETEMLRTIDDACTRNNIPYYLVCGSVLGAVRHKGAIPWDNDVDITVPLPEIKRFCEVMKKELVDTPYQIFVPEENKDGYILFPRISIRKYNHNILHIDVFLQIGISSDPKEQIVHTEKLFNLKNRFYKKCIAKHSLKSLKSFFKNFNLICQTLFYSTKQIKKEFTELCLKYPYEKSEYVTNPCGHYKTKNIVPKTFFGTPKRIPYEDLILPVPEKTDDYLKHYYGDYMKFPKQEIIDKGMKYSITIDENE